MALCTRMFGASEKLAARLWREYTPPPLVLWQLGLCTSTPDDAQRWHEHLRRLGELVPPRTILALSLALAPEAGRPRAVDVVRFEEAVLNNVDRKGQWTW